MNNLNKTLLIGLLTTLVVPVVPLAEAHLVGAAGSPANCGWPCATTSCSGDHVRADAAGDQGASVSARGVVPVAATGTSVYASVAAAGSSSADASASHSDGRRPASSCVFGTTTESSLEVGCIADDRIGADALFAGDVYELGDGTFIAQDALGRTMEVGASTMFHGAALDGLVVTPREIGTPLGATLVVELERTEDERRCFVGLF